jgi:hypothetical protein
MTLRDAPHLPTLSTSELSDFSTLGGSIRIPKGSFLLTNDGDLTFRATHPSFGLEKTYIIEFDGKLPVGVDKTLSEGSN